VQCAGAVTYRADVELEDASGLDTVMVDHATPTGADHRIQPGQDPDDGSHAVVGTSIETVDASCGTGEDDAVAVTFEDDAVALEGVLPAPNPCHEALVEAASYEAGTLSVAIDAADATGEDEGCVQCHGSVTYRADVELEDASAVETVLVDHATPTGGEHELDPDDESSGTEDDEFDESDENGTDESGEDGTNESDDDGTDGSDDDDEYTPDAVVDASIETVEAECSTGEDGEVEAECSTGEDGEVEVAFEGASVVVEGSLPAPTPCHEAALADVEIEGDELSLRVDVRSTGEVCVECVGAIEYEAVVELDGAITIESVRIDHVTRGGDESVVAR
jgi:hypothetical protein